MSSAESGNPAGTPSTIMTSAGPCDSPAVRKRSIGRPFYRTFCNVLSPRAVSGTGKPGELLAMVTRVPLEIFADRFLRDDSGRHIDLATGEQVLVTVEPWSTRGGERGERSSVEP